MVKENKQGQGTTHSYRLLNYGLQSKLGFALSSGTKEHNYKVDVKLEITDIYGVSVTVHFNVKVCLFTLTLTLPTSFLIIR